MDATQHQEITVEIVVRRGPDWLRLHGYPPDAEIIETVTGTAELVEED